MGLIAWKTRVSLRVHSTYGKEPDIVLPPRIGTLFLEDLIIVWGRGEWMSSSKRFPRHGMALNPRTFEFNACLNNSVSSYHKRLLLRYMYLTFLSFLTLYYIDISLLIFYHISLFNVYILLLMCT